MRTAGLTGSVPCNLVMHTSRLDSNIHIVGIVRVNQLSYCSKTRIKPYSYFLSEFELCKIIPLRIACSSRKWWNSTTHNRTRHPITHTHATMPASSPITVEFAKVPFDIYFTLIMTEFSQCKPNVWGHCYLVQQPAVMRV